MPRSFWKRLVIPENVSVWMLNILAISSLAMMGVVMVVAPRLPELERTPMIKEDGSFPLDPPFSKSAESAKERLQQYFLKIAKQDKGDLPKNTPQNAKTEN